MFKLISSVSFPYSRSYSKDIFLPGNLFCFLIIIIPSLSLLANAEPKIKPLASIAAMESNLNSVNNFQICLMTRQRHLRC